MPKTTLIELVRFFENKYQRELEPWEYNERAVEILRQEFIVRTALEHKPFFRNVLDVGCSLGQLSFRLAGAAQHVFAVDVSATALKKIRSDNRVKSSVDSTCFHFLGANAATLPFPPASFDLILLCDGLMSWELPENHKRQSLVQAHQTLSPEGLVLLSEYMRPEGFDYFLSLIEQSPLTIKSVHYLHDRLCYQLETLLQAFRRTRFVNSIVGSRPLAKGLISLGSLFGNHGSKHICVVAGKNKDRE